MAEKLYGNENLKALADVVIEAGDIADDAWADKKINFYDAPQIVRAGPLAAKLPSVLIMVPKEAGELDAEESQELSAHIEKRMKEFGLDPESDTFSELLGKTYDLVVGIAQKFTQAVDLVGDFKEAINASKA
tara:strand:- start:21 stop:416 length:396 start_codon:yes stop_codon:yes gene_type:complete